MKKIVVWYNPNKKKYYYRIVHGLYYDYKPGLKNNYNHEVILVINLSTICNSCFHTTYNPIKLVLRRLISFLQNIQKRL